MICKYFPTIKYSMIEKTELLYFPENSNRSMNEISKILMWILVKISNKRKDFKLHFHEFDTTKTSQYKNDGYQINGPCI